MNSWRSFCTADCKYKKDVGMSRTKVLFLILAVWFCLILLRLGYLASNLAEKYRISSETVSGKSYPLPAIRGSILDAKGKPLVWSEKHYDLEISGTLETDELEKLKALLPKRDISSELNVGKVFASLTLGELTALENMLRHTPALHIKTRIERVLADHPEVRKLAGKIDSATQTGVSGWEKEFDVLLRGKDGKLQVNRDSGGRWVKNSSEIVMLPVPGQNVKVNFSLDQRSNSK